MPNSDQALSNFSLRFQNTVESRLTQDIWLHWRFLAVEVTQDLHSGQYPETLNMNTLEPDHMGPNTGPTTFQTL